MKHLLLFRLLDLFDGFFLLYAMAISSVYLILAVVSLYALHRYLRKTHVNDYSYILHSPFAPGISLLAPAYNEGLTIIENVKSLLSIMYNKLEVIIINDGSKDQTLSILIEAFDLVKVAYSGQRGLKTTPVHGVYKSKNLAFKKLTVVDKQNGGKADALNAGINMSTHELIACIDVDCIIEREALLKMVRPFLESTTPVIATGGVVRIANSCVVEGGRLQEVRLPRSRVARFQTLEYMRAFLIGRMAWSKLNGLLLISGAFGLFRRDIALKVGGYDTATVGEDMELVVRMRAHMHEHQLPYKVEYIPEPLCWTEAPSEYKILSRQRNRWTRGTAETLWKHKRLFFNPRYGLMGLVSYPFWFFFEWMAPLVELTGLVYVAFLVAAGQFNFTVSLTLLLAVYSFSFFITMVALMAEEFSYYQYKRKREILKLVVTALIEPLVFHPRVVWWAFLGNIDLLKGKKSWGEMTRQGFVSSTPKMAVKV